MRVQSVCALAVAVVWAHAAFPYVPGKAPSGADRHWPSGAIPVRLMGPAEIDGNDVHHGARNAIASWNAVPHARIRLTELLPAGPGAPSIGNGTNEIGWVESSDNPYFVPGVPCTTAYIYDTLIGAMIEADTTCDAKSYQWPDRLFGLAPQDHVADAETAALAAFGTWLGLDASLFYGDPMDAVTGSGRVIRLLLEDQLAFGRYRYGDGTSAGGTIGGAVRFPDGSPIPYAYVMAIGLDSGLVYGSVTDASGAYTIHEVAAGAYLVVVRSLTTDPSVESSLPYRANPHANLDFTPEYYAGGATIVVRNGSVTSSIDIIPLRAGTQADADEPNDSAAAAAPLTIGFSRLATTHVPLDADWYTFNTQPNTCYVVATWFEGASTTTVDLPDGFWSRTRLTLFDGENPVASNESRDEIQDDPRNWLTYCEGSAGRRLDVMIQQRSPVGGAGYFYAVSVQALADGIGLVPTIDGIFPSSGWAGAQQYLWIQGSGFLPGAQVEFQLANGARLAAPAVLADGCDPAYHCEALKVLRPPGSAGVADVTVTNPNGRAVTKVSAFTYLDIGHRPVLDRTPQAFGMRYGQGRAVCIGDFDGDGREDIFKSRYASLPYQLFRNRGDGTFSDEAGASGLRLPPALYGQSCSFVDVDDDGDLDLYATNLSPSSPGGSINELYINRLAETGTAGFVLRTPAGLAGEPGRYQTDAVWADFDRDGRLDVVLVDDAYAASAPYHDAVHLMRQNADGTFSDITASSGLSGFVATITTARTADFNGDGCDDLAFFTYAGAANRLYTGNCHGQFTDRSAASHIADGSPWCLGVAIADFDGDGSPDIFCGTYNTGPVPIRPRLWINNGNGAFADRASAAGLYAIARNLTLILPLDIDNDGIVDVYGGASENGSPDDRKDVLLRNRGGSPPVFEDITEAVGMYPTTQDGSAQCGHGVDEFLCDRDAAAGGVFDWYADGGQDVFVTGDDPDALQRGSDVLWRNEQDVTDGGAIEPGRDWIEIVLAGANSPASRVLSNRFGIGAQVTVAARFDLPGGAVPTETQCLQNPLPARVSATTREVVLGNQSQSSVALHFGLGDPLPLDRKSVDCVRVIWPSGLERAYTGLVANSRVVLAEDGGRMKVIAVVPNSGETARSEPTTIKGVHFDRDVAVVPQVFFGSVPARSVTFVSEHELTVLPPLYQPPGPVDVTVANTNGELDTLRAAYTFVRTGNYIRIKDPVPEIVDASGLIPNDPAFVAFRGVERTGVIADGVTRLILEAEAPGLGSVRIVLDDDDDALDAAPSGARVGLLSGLDGADLRTAVIVPTAHLSDGRFIAHAIYTAPAEFVQSSADVLLAKRSIRVRASYIDADRSESPMLGRSLDLYRVPILLVHGIWSDASTFGWPALDDPRWIVHRADYREASGAGFAENRGVPPRATAELRKKIHGLGIAGTRFFVFAHSMGAVLFKIFIGGGGAPYLRADNFFEGDVHALVSVDAPFSGSYLASLARYAVSLDTIGPEFAEMMSAVGLDVDRGCMSSLDPAGSEISAVPSANGRFHAMVGWGGREMRASGAHAADDLALRGLESVLLFFNFSFDNYLQRCDEGDDFVVCTETQRGGLTGGAVDDFHFAGLTSRAIHFDSITREVDPSMAVERLLNTPTRNGPVWGSVLPASAPAVSSVRVGQAVVPRSQEVHAPDDALSLSITEQGDGVVLASPGATRLWKSLVPDGSAGVCLPMTDGGYTDADVLDTTASLFYIAGADSLCALGGGFGLSAVSPASGSSRGGYTVTLVGSGFDTSDKVKVGAFFADSVRIVNSSMLTFRMPSGSPGTAWVSLVNGSGAETRVQFTYLEPIPVGGSVRITSPANGARIPAGSTMTIAAVGVGGFKIASALAAGLSFASDRDRDPGDGFATTVTVPVQTIGSLEIHFVAKDEEGNVKRATPVTVDVIPPGGADLIRLEAEKVTLLYASPSKQIRVYGVYSDGMRREVTHATGIVFEMDLQDARRPDYPYNGTGVAVVDPSGMVTAKTHGTTACHVTYAGAHLDIVVEVAEIRPTLSVMKPGLLSWPYQGAGVNFDLIRGKLSALRATGGRYADPAVALICIKNDFADVAAADITLPPVGDGLFYLLRDSATRSYDEAPFWSTRTQSGSRAIINSAPGSCP